ncbi:alpha/beta hydrolase [Gilvimarinus xylanilyticus]|uniref:Alpha/beta hydrolase n=1 Tax=Gilvimarinus xylanilyticus TaxID=2944139 RepID=A0A9X2KT76_9GAMM|nr:alpha/beta hydrolase [Gilvimarinus xylanilyticus]MCP8899621.1 alpha/beta hydrolase [Gilvimarinus xylanilyticus]
MYPTIKPSRLSVVWAALLTLLSFSPLTLSQEPLTMDIYAGAIPGALKSDDLEHARDPDHPDTFLQKVTYPTLTAYLPEPDIATGSAVIICPGGGYQGVSIVKEGYQVAERLQSEGVAAFVLKYRDPLDKTMADKKFGPLQDVQQAIAMVRAKADQWRLKSDRIGIMGFSAGGHLASSAAVHFADPVLERLSPEQVRPDFQVLIYPVINVDSDIAHQGSRTNLLGVGEPSEWWQYFSNEQQVTTQTPPAFLVHAGDDGAVRVENSLRYYQALHAQDVPAGMLILPQGGHGFGMRNPVDWFATMLQWMKSEDLY